LKHQSPLFSIVIPTYNREQSLCVAIQSVIDQNVTDWELLVVDDGSTEETMRTVKKFQDNRIKYCRQEHNERSLARNLGISRSRGNYVCFLDDDDYLLENHLQLFSDYLSRHHYPEEILRVGFLVKENQDLTPSKLFSEKLKKHPVFYFSNEMCGIWSLCIPRQFLTDHTFPPDFPHWQDSHLALRLLSIYPFKQLNAWTYVYCQHDKMGSIDLFRGPNIETRVQLQVDAINDLFDNYAYIIQPFLKEKDRQRLIAEKMFRGARLYRSEGNQKAAWRMMCGAPLNLKTIPSILKFIFTSFKILQ